MKVKELMTDRVVKIHPGEAVSVAARTMTHYNIGSVPVCDEHGKLCGILTDRDIVTRCLAGNRCVETTTVGEIMTAQVVSVQPETEASAAAHMMGSRQIRRLPVVKNGDLCGMVSLGDLANSAQCTYDAGDALAEITGNISNR